MRHLSRYSPAGAQYLSIAGDPGVVIRGKKGTEGLTVKKTATALVVGIYGEGVSAGEANTVVENLVRALAGSDPAIVLSISVAMTALREAFPT